MTEITFRRLDLGLPPPRPAHRGDAGVDLRATDPVDIPPGGRAVVGTGIAVAIPVGYAGLVVPRSGYARRHGVGLVNAPGLIDSGYRGEVSVLLVNHGRDPVRFERGDRIAQLVVVRLPDCAWVEVDELPPSDRGTGGFGSTGRD